MIITKTPFRISFFGGGTDYPAWFRENGGAVLSTTIDKYGYITCRYLPPFFEYNYRVSYTLIEMVKEIRDIKHPSVRTCLDYMKVRQGVEIHYDGDLPARTGLGSSSAFTVGLLKSLHALQGRLIDDLKLGKEAIHVEQNVIPENVGCQDQLAAAMGGFNLMEFGPGAGVAVHPFVLPKESLTRFKSHLLLVFTGFSRNASEIAGRVIRNTGKKKAELRAIHQMTYEAVKILKNAPGRNLSDFGRLMHEGWKIKRTLAEGITSSAIDHIYDMARKGGAVGGKLLGAGGGGFLLLFAPPERHARLKKALRSLLHVPFGFENMGSQIVYYKPDEYAK